MRTSRRSALPALLLLAALTNGCSRRGSGLSWLAIGLALGSQQRQSPPKQIPWTKEDQIRSDRIWYIHSNLGAFVGDLNRGGGESLSTYALLRGCPKYVHSYLGTVARDHGDEIARQTDAMGVYQKLEQRIAADRHLRRACGVDQTVSDEPSAALAGASTRFLSLREAQRAVVLPMRTLGGLPRDAAAIFTGLLVSELSTVGNLEAVGPRDVEALLQVEKMKDLVGCDTTTCAAEIGGALGTDLVLHGSISHLGSQYVVVLNVVDSSKIMVLGRVQRVLPAEADMLTGILPDMVVELVLLVESQARPLVGG